MKYLNIKKALAAWQELQPLSEKDKDRLSRRFTVDFNYNSNHIEGNTLTYGQTEVLLLFGKVIGEASVRDVQEMTASNVGLRMMTDLGLGSPTLHCSLCPSCHHPSCCWDCTMPLRRVQVHVQSRWIHCKTLSHNEKAPSAAGSASRLPRILFMLHISVRCWLRI